MEDLIELVKVVTKNKTKGIEIIGSQKRDSRAHDFYHRLVKGEFRDDDAAARFYFDKSSFHPQYRKLKNTLRQKLINTAFFIDVSSPKFNDVQRAFYTCQRNTMAIRILLGRNARRSGIQLAKKTLRVAGKFEFSDLTLELSRILRAHHAIHVKNARLHEKYSLMAEEFQNICQAEDRALAYYENTSVMLAKSQTRKNEVVQRCSEYIELLKPLTEKWDTYKLHLWFYFILLRKESLELNHENIVRVCDQAIKFFVQKETVSSQFIGAFYYNKLMAYIKLRNFEQGRFLALKCNKIFENGSIRWFNTQGFSFILYMHDRKYLEAFKLRNQVVEHMNFGDQQQNKSETWKIYDAYLFYLIKDGKLRVPIDSELRKFRLIKFLNEVPVFSLDKQGLNIPILIIQILNFIRDRKYEVLSDRLEAIEKYASRYLKKGANYRSSCFIKMLLQIPRRQFHREAVIRHTSSLSDKLHSYSLEVADQPFEIEIIPYEHLWEYALESLDNKFH